MKSFSHAKILLLSPEEARNALAKLEKTNEDPEFHHAIEMLRESYSDYPEEDYMKTIYDDRIKGEWYLMTTTDSRAGINSESVGIEEQMCFIILIDGWTCDLTLGEFDTAILPPWVNISGVFEKNEDGEWEATLIPVERHTTPNEMQRNFRY